VVLVEFGLVGVDGLPEGGKWAGCCGGGLMTALCPLPARHRSRRWRAEDVEALSTDTIALRSLGLM